MPAKTPPSLTLEEAVARMVNMDYIPDGCTLLEMTEAFQEEAEVSFENARIENKPAEVINRLRLRTDACRSRHVLAGLLMQSLREEIARDGGRIASSPDSSSISRYTVESIASWAADRYGIGFFEGSNDKTDLVSDLRWEDVNIKIYSGYRIGFSTKKGEWKTMPFRDLGMMGRRRSEPNQEGLVLIGLSEGRKYPPTRHVEQTHKTTMSRLTRALRRLTGLPSGAFHRPNEADGWKPRFRLIDDRRNREERAKAAALFEPYSEAHDFEVEDDDAQKYIDDNE